MQEVPLMKKDEREEVSGKQHPHENEGKSLFFDTKSQYGCFIPEWLWVCSRIRTTEEKDAETRGWVRRDDEDEEGSQERMRAKSKGQFFMSSNLVSLQSDFKDYPFLASHPTFPDSQFFTKEQNKDLRCFFLKVVVHVQCKLRQVFTLVRSLLFFVLNRFHPFL